MPSAKHITVSAVAISFLAALAFTAPASALPPFAKRPWIIGGPGTTTPQYIMDLESASAALKKLDQDSRTLYTDQDALIERVYNIKTTLQTTADRLGILTTLDSDLKKLEASVNAAYTAAETAETIPQAREKAKKMKATLGTAKANVTAARTRMDAIVAKTEPLRQKMEKAAGIAGKVQTGLTVVNEGPIAKMRFPISVAAGCVNKIPAPRHDCAAKNIDDTAADVDAVVVEYDRVVKLLLTNPEPWLPSVSFLDPFKANLDAVDKLRADMEKLAKQLEGLTSNLKKLNAVLDQSFGFSFPYPDPTITNPIRTSTCHVDIGFKTIIQGVGKIEDEIEDKIGKTLYKVLETIGVRKFVDQLKDKADSAVNALMRAINFDITVNLPSLAPLDQLEKLLPGLDAKLDGLKFPEIDLDTPAFGFPEVKPGIDFRKIKISAGFFNPSGLMPDKANMPHICDGAAFGCN